MFCLLSMLFLPFCDLCKALPLLHFTTSMSVWHIKFSLPSESWICPSAVFRWNLSLEAHAARENVTPCMTAALLRQTSWEKLEMRPSVCMLFCFFFNFLGNSCRRFEKCWMSHMIWFSVAGDVVYIVLLFAVFSLLSLLCLCTNLKQKRTLITGRTRVDVP